MKLFTLTVFTILLALNAEAAHSKFICSYQGAEAGAIQVLIFEGPEDLNLLRINNQKIKFFVNGQTDALQFDVKKVILHVSDEIVFTSQSKFFLSDITLRIVNHVVDGITSFKGTWETDSPFVARLNCIFLN